MGIGSITSMNNRPGMQTAMTSPADSKSKSIKNEITDMQQQMQSLSSKEELSVNEKMNERKKLQKEISSLNTELKQHQEKLRKSQKREIMTAELQENKEPEKEKTSENKIQTNETSADKTDKNNPPTASPQPDQPGSVITKDKDGIVILKDENKQDEKRSIDTGKKQEEDTRKEIITEKETKNINSDIKPGFSSKETHALVSADISVQQSDRQGTVITRIRNGIAILKGEIRQDERLGTDTEKKQAELEKMEKKEQRAMEFQSSVFGEANNTTKPAAKMKVSGTEANQANADDNASVHAFKQSQEDAQVSLQGFYVSLGN